MTTLATALQAALRAADNASTDLTVTATNGSGTSGNLIVTSASGKSIGALTLTTNAGAGSSAGTMSTSIGSTYVGDFQLSSPSNSPITLGSAVGGTIANADLTTGTYVANTAQVVSAQRSVATTAAPVLGSPLQTTGQGILDGSSLKLNGVVIGAAVSTDDTSSDTTATSSSKSASAIAIAAAINKSTNLTGVTAVAQANTIVGSSIDSSARTLIGTDIYLNGVDIVNTLNTGYKSADVAKLLNQYTGQTGVVAQDNGLGVTLTAADGRNISIGVQGTNGVTGLGLAAGSVASNLTVGLTGGGASYANQAATTYARVALQSNKQFTVQSGNAGDINLNLLGFSTGTFGGANNGLKIAAIDVSTQAGAQNAITAIDAALVTVSANQSRAGAFINRLNNVVTNQTSMQSNMTTSRSAIQDTDYSAETTNLAKSQIISQAATAMLAQANQSAQNVLALLK
jgi:flagellin